VSSNSLDLKLIFLRRNFSSLFAASLLSIFVEIGTPFRSLSRKQTLSLWPLAKAEHF
jgi:hypothetical protein